MKGLVVVALLLFADGKYKNLFAFSNSTFEFNFNYFAVSFSSPLKEETPEHRWSLIPNSEGKMNLVDLDSFEVSVEPSFVAENDVVFLLFTRQNRDVGQVITFDRASLLSSNFNPSHPTRFTVHGWQSDAETISNSIVREAFFQLGDFNVRHLI